MTHLMRTENGRAIYRDVALPPKRLLQHKATSLIGINLYRLLKVLILLMRLKTENQGLKPKQYWRHNTITGDPDSYQQAIK